MMERVDAVVTGAGVVGLAVARALALAGREVIILEKEKLIGSGTSSRNSEVIHAGIYYRAGSLMARLCVDGRRQLYAYCSTRNIPHRRLGKLIVATNDAEAENLDGIRQRAAANGVDDLVPLSAAQARDLEPALAATAALLSPSTGIIDSHAYMLALKGEAEAAGAAIAFSSPLLGARVVGGGFELDVGGDDPMQLGANILVNAAGLHAPDLAGLIEGLDRAFIPRAYYAKGSYFALAGTSPFSRLIYPVPVPGGLGVHLTHDMQGNARFGPDVEWVDAIDYKVDHRRCESFYAAIRRYWPELTDGALVPAYSGIRPKIVSPDVAVQDFRIDDRSVHGIDGLVNLFGIESPGLTASLAIADAVVQRIYS